jgi:hypothetical protein
LIRFRKGRNEPFGKVQKRREESPEKKGRKEERRKGKKRKAKSRKNAA